MKIQESLENISPPLPDLTQIGEGAATPSPVSENPIENTKPSTQEEFSTLNASVTPEPLQKASNPYVIPDNINDFSIHEAIHFYIQELNFPVIPLHPITNTEVNKPGKQPMIRGYRQKKVSDMTEEYLAKWFPDRTDRNLGAILQDQFMWIDLDAKQDEGASAKVWLEQNQKFKEYPRVRTQHGYHIPCVVPDIPINAKKLAHEVSGMLVIELLTPPHPVTLPPSLRVDGTPYTWEQTGKVMEVPWKKLLRLLDIPEKKPGRPKKPRHFSHKFKGDLKTLDLQTILQDKGMLGDCLDEGECKFAVRCPWEHEHSDRHEDIRGDTAVWLNAGTIPGFKCLHAHCDERHIEHLLEWLEEQEPGVVDGFCNEYRVYSGDDAETKNGKPLLEHPGDNRLISGVAKELADAVAPMHAWFQRNGSVCEVTRDPKTDRLIFRDITAIAACGGVERFVTPVAVRYIDEETVKVPRSFGAKEIAPILGAPQFINNLPIIDRLLSIRQPVLNNNGEIVRPQLGYDPELRTYLQPDAPKIEKMSVSEAKKVIDDIFSDFCFSSEQDKIHAVARLITPYVRGVMGWTARMPLWLFIANRPRAGKDYLSGVVSILYTGEIQEDAPLEQSSEETRKRITAALMSGRLFMHFANCQGYINDAMFIGSVTNRRLRVRNLGSTAANADLELPNEIEFSLSANVGVTYREDIEPRSRRITLAFFEEDANKRAFRHSDLHGYIRANRGRILGAVGAFVTEWIRQDMPSGATPFTSFPEWARVVGGVMNVNDLGDPCLPHEAELALGGDLKERAMRVVYRIGYAKWPNEWVTKAKLFDALKDVDDEDLLWFGPWQGDEAKGTRNKVGMALKAYKQRILENICLSIDEGGKGANQKIRFTSELQKTAPNDGNLGNLGNLVTPEGSKKPQTKKLSHITVKYPEKLPAEKVSKVSEVSPPSYQLITNTKELTHVVEALSVAPSVALDSETYGPGKKGALNPRQGRVRLLQLAIPGHTPWLIDIKATGEDLGSLKQKLESIEVIIHNARFDLAFLREHLKMSPKNVYCTMTASQLLTAGTKDKNDLTSCLRRHLDIPAYQDESRSDWSGELTQSQLAYAASDTQYLHQLREALDREIDQASLRKVAEIEMNLITVVVDIEEAGLRVDRQKLTHQINAACQASDLARQELRELSAKPGLNPNSPQQVKEMLRGQGLDLSDTRQETLAAYTSHKCIRKLLDFRKQSKLASMLQKLNKELGSDGRLRASFNPLGTCTGRFSSSGPNLQNIPRGAPRAIIHPQPDHKFVRADYGQIELRIAAALTGENEMLKAFKSGKDLHRLTAAFVTDKNPADITSQERQEAKAVNFGFLYGQGAEGFRKRAKAEYGLDLSLKRAEELRTSFFEVYPAFEAWHKQVWRAVRSSEKETRTRTGRRRLIPSGTKDWGRFTALVNTPVQGLGADGMKLALIRLNRELPKGAKVVLTVHDDVLVECLQEVANDVKSLIETIMIEEMLKLIPNVPIIAEAEILDVWK